MSIDGRIYVDDFDLEGQALGIELSVDASIIGGDIGASFSAIAVSLSGTLSQYQYISGSLDVSDFDMSGTASPGQVGNALIRISDFDMSGSMVHNSYAATDYPISVLRIEFSGTLVSSPVISGDNVALKIDISGGFGASTPVGGIAITGTTMSGDMVNGRLMSASFTALNPTITGTLTSENLIDGLINVTGFGLRGSIVNSSLMSGGFVFSGYGMYGTGANSAYASGSLEFDDIDIYGELLQEQVIFTRIPLKALRVTINAN